MTDILAAEKTAKWCDFKVKVSSVLNRQVKEYGKAFMFDGREDTCWNSDQGSPQWILLDFGSRGQQLGQLEKGAELQIMFQGGFSGKTCWIEEVEDGARTLPDELLSRRHDIYPEDINKLQKFPLSLRPNLKSLKIVFDDSTDFFGRVTVYQLKLVVKP